MITDACRSHHMKDLIQCSDTSRKSHQNIRFPKHRILPFTQVIHPEGNIEPITDSTTFLQFGRHDTHDKSAVFLGCLGDAFHQPDIGTSIH